MDIKTYVKQHKNSGQTLTSFAEKAGIKLKYLDHILNNRKKNPRLELILGLAEASEGEITISKMRPDLFPDNAQGRQRLRLLKKICA